MLTTNLLPQSEQKEIRFEEIRRVILFFAVGLTIIIGIGIVLLIPSYLLIFVEQQELDRLFATEKNASDRLSIDKTTADIQIANRVFMSLRNSGTDSSQAAFIFDTIFKKTGTVLSIQRLSVQSSREVEIRGFASTRGDLLAFEESLRRSDIFHSIVSPLSNIIKETDITFSIQGQLRQEYSL